MLLPGALQSAAVFAALLPALTAHRPVITLDLSGHAGRPIPDEFRTADLADDVRHQLLARGVTRAHVYGYSLGGYVALHLARHHPAHVASVFTHATKLAWTADSAAREAAGLHPDTLRTRAPKFAAALERTHAGQDWTLLVTRFAAFLARLGATPEVTDADLRALTLPVQVAVGDRDALVTLEETITAYRALPQGQLLVLPGVQHPLPSVPAERLAGELLAFIDRAEANAASMGGSGRG